MSLFIGRVPSRSTTSDLESIFKKYGKMTRCDIKSGQSVSFINQFNFGFVEYEDKRDAEDAVKAHEDREFELDGQKIIVEFAKGPKRDRRDRSRDRGRDRSRSRDRGRRDRGGSGAGDCFVCKKSGHWARECPEGNGDRRRRSPRRSPRRSRSRSPARKRD